MVQKDPNKPDNWKQYSEEPKDKNLSLLNRFVDRIRSTFQKFQTKAPREPQLMGRIHDLQKTANSVLKQLRMIKDEFRKEVDPDVFAYVEEVIDNIIKEVSRLHKSIEQPGSVLQQAKRYQRYSQWVEKAKLWVQICSKMGDKQSIIKAIIRYTIDDFLEVIDRDIQVINDYQEHMLDALAVDEEEKIALAQRLEMRLEPYLKSLNDLRTKPKDLPLHEIALWKSQVDKRREKFFDAALHAIDKIINQSIPDTTGEEEHEHLVDVLSQVIYLEHEVPSLYDAIYMSKNPSKIELSEYMARLDLLEHEVHQLNLDLRLTPDLIDRLQVVSEMLEYARKKLLQ